jgi:cytosine/adenosine deaminase-related metal-dependent hydrolase
MVAVEAQWRLARELGMRISVHVGNGLKGTGRAVARLHEAGLMGDDTTYIHTNTLADDEIGMIASTGGTASAAPAVEASMGHGASAIRRLRDAGVTTGLSVDTCTSAAGDLFGVMRAALLLVRTAEHERRIAAGEPADTIAVRTADALAMATLYGAVANGLGATTGSLTVGKQADIVVLHADRPNLTPMSDAAAAVVLAAHPGNVDSVFVAGRRLKANGVLLDLDMRELGAQAREAAARIAEE